MLQSSGVAKRWTQPSNWTELIELELPNSHYLLSIRSSPLLPYNNFHTISVLLILLSIFLRPTSPTKMSPPLFKEIDHVSCHCWKALFPILHIAEKGARYILLTQPRFLANAISKEGASLVTQVVKHLPSNVGNLGSIPGSRRSPGGGNGNPLQYSCLENPMDRGAWWATVHGVAKSWTQLSDFAFTFRKSQGWFLPRTFGGHKAFLTPWFWTSFQNCKRINFSCFAT